MYTLFILIILLLSARQASRIERKLNTLLQSNRYSPNNPNYELKRNKGKK
jgi:hypothetical protein